MLLFSATGLNLFFLQCQLFKQSSWDTFKWTESLLVQVSGANQKIWLRIHFEEKQTKKLNNISEKNPFNRF
jgi:hypothetical protein